MDAPSWLAPLLLSEKTQLVPSLAVVRERPLVKQPMSWSDAQCYCRGKHHPDLLTVPNQDDWARVSGMVANSAAGEAWIGLHDEMTSWGWSLDNTSLYQDRNTHPGSWLSPTADNASGDEYFVYMAAGAFRDRGCQSGCYIICYDEHANTYHPFYAVHTWFEAQTICRETYTDLVSVRNQAELESIKAAFIHYSHFCWVVSSRANWTWSDQSKFSFRAWSVDQASAGLMNCTYADAVVTSKVIKVVLKINRQTNPNDPQILMALQKQREMLLREQGSNPEARLKWLDGP